MIRMRQDVDVIAMLRNAGYSTYRIAHEHLIGQSTLTKLRRRGLPSWNELNIICTLCRCCPWDIIEYIPDESQGRITSDLPVE